MASFLFKSYPALGHINPTKPIIRKLIERNHDVVWMTGREFKESVESTGAYFRPMPLEDDPNGRNVYDFYPELGKLKGIAQIKWYIRHA